MTAAHQTPTWVTTTSTTIARLLEGSGIVSTALWRGTCTYLRTCPMHRRRTDPKKSTPAWYWVAAAYLAWGSAGLTALAAALAPFAAAGWLGAGGAALTWIGAAWWAARPQPDDQGDQDDQDDGVDERDPRYRARGAVLLSCIVLGGVAAMTVPGWAGAALAALLWGAAAALGAAPFRGTPEDDEEEENAQHSLTKATDTAAPAAESPEMDPALQLCWQLIGTAPGVHLSALAEAFTRLHPEAPVTPRDMRQWADEMGVPVRASVKGRKRGAPGAPISVSQGIHRDDLQAVTGPPPSPLPPPPPEAVAHPVVAPVATEATQLNWGVAAPVAGVATRSTTPSGPVINRDPSHPNRYTVHAH